MSSRARFRVPTLTLRKMPYNRFGVFASSVLLPALLACGGVAESAHPDLASSAHLVVDLNTQPYDPTFERNSSFPSFLTAGKGAALFVAFPNWGGGAPLKSALYRSDGTAEGTSVIRPSGDDYPTGLGAVNGQVAFLASDETGAPGLWVSDGTQPGTAVLQPFVKGTFAHNEGVDDSGYYVFVNDDASSGGRLWRTDGTASGTVAVFAGSRMTFNSASTRHGFYFATSDVVGFSRIMKTNGTWDGTTEIGTIPADTDGWMCGIGDSVLVVTRTDTAFTLWVGDSTGVRQTTQFSGAWTTASCISVGERAILRALDDQGTMTLWGTDGTEPGTDLLSDATGSEVLGDSAYFTTGDGLYRTDGTANGTVKVFDGGFAGFRGQLGNRLLLSTETDNPHADLWITDGTTKGTHLIWKNPDVAAGNFTLAGDNVVFNGYQRDTGYELWAAPRAAFE